MIRFIASPKPFRDHFAVIQRNAIQSWQQRGGAVLLFGGEDGGLPARRFERVARTEQGTPLLSDIFAQAHAATGEPVLCYLNCDLILLDDFLPAVQRVAAVSSRFLVIGQCWDMDVPAPVDFTIPVWSNDLRQRVKCSATRRGPWALDFFAFSRGLFPEVLPFAIGRAGFDNWLVWRAVHSGATVVDITESATVIHQNHDYSHVPGGRDWSYRGVEAQQNLALAGPVAVKYDVRDATHRLTGNGVLCRNWRYYRRALKHWRHQHGLRRDDLLRMLRAKENGARGGN